MNVKEFRQQVEDFLSLFFQDYMRDAQVEYDFSDPEDLKATVVIDDMDGNEWRVPICKDCDGGVAISNDPQMWTLDLDESGLFAFLWIEACAKLREQKGS